MELCTRIITALLRRMAGPSLTLVLGLLLVADVHPLDGASPSGNSPHFLPVVTYRPSASAGCPAARPDNPIATPAGQAQIEGGDAVKWHPLILTFTGPYADQLDSNPNPFLDYRLQVTFYTPGGHTYTVPGFFNGDGQGAGSGTAWQVRFAPDETGRWSYCVSFRSGNDVAISLDPAAGVGTAFDGAWGTFEVTAQNPNAPGFLKWGRLEYVGRHYLKFRDGPYWLKGGTNSPENFLGYAGFDNTEDQGGLIDNFVHLYFPHVADWQAGDPFFVSEDTGIDSRGIIGALNYLSQQHVNSIYFLPLNLGGDGQETYPFDDYDGSPFDNTHYDLSKLHQWNVVLQHAQRKGIAVHIVLNETEQPNRTWLDAGELGVQRKLFYREMAARFGYLLALKWNLSEENVFPMEKVWAFSNYLQAHNWAGHPLTLHTQLDNAPYYYPMLGDGRYSATSVQFSPDLAGTHTEYWRAESVAAGRPWVIDLDENGPAGTGLMDDNDDDLRRRVLYDVYFSGGNLEWYAGYHDLPLGGDVNLEDFRTREDMWNYMWYARSFMEENLPFWEMAPADNLLGGESGDYGGGEVFALLGEVYAVYLPNATPSPTLQVQPADAPFQLRWYNPRTGQFTGTPQTIWANGGLLPLGQPPADATLDWVLLVTPAGEP